MFFSRNFESTLKLIIHIVLPFRWNDRNNARFTDLDDFSDDDEEPDFPLDFDSDSVIFPILRYI